MFSFKYVMLYICVHSYGSEYNKIAYKITILDVYRILLSS